MEPAQKQRQMAWFNLRAGPEPATGGGVGRIGIGHRPTCRCSWDCPRLAGRAIPQKGEDVVRTERVVYRVNDNMLASETDTSPVVSEGVTASLVRSSPYTIHGWRPT